MIEYRQQQSAPKSRRSRRRRKKRDKQKDMVEAPPSQDDLQSQHPSFHSFPNLPDELKLYILSFVAQVSWDTSNSEQRCSTLTHVFPLVSHEFHHLARSDYLWQTTLANLVETEPTLWSSAVLKLCEDCDDEETTLDKEQELYSLPPQELVTLAHSITNEPGYCRLYRMILARYMRFTSPIFCMTDRRVQLGTPISLHFFEPRYRLLIQMVMEGYPQEFRDGRSITTKQLPSFVYAHEPPFDVNSKACLVEVHRCHIDEDDGRANVLLMPVSFVRMERVWERPNTGNLYFAQCLRLSKDDSLSSSSLETQGRHRSRNAQDGTRAHVSCCVS